MSIITQLTTIAKATAQLGVKIDLTETVADIQIAVFWDVDGLKIGLTDGNEYFITTSVKEAKKALRYAINNPRLARYELVARSGC